jgi:hypothetical protein
MTYPRLPLCTSVEILPIVKGSPRATCRIKVGVPRQLSVAELCEQRQTLPWNYTRRVLLSNSNWIISSGAGQGRTDHSWLTLSVGGVPEGLVEFDLAGGEGLEQGGDLAGNGGDGVGGAKLGLRRRGYSTYGRGAAMLRCKEWAARRKI